MCGISVIVALEGHLGGKDVHGANDDIRSKISKELDRSLAMIAHRGPDSQGKWISEDNRVGKLSRHGSFGFQGKYCFD